MVPGVIVLQSVHPGHIPIFPAHPAFICILRILPVAPHYIIRLTKLEDWTEKAVLSVLFLFACFELGQQWL